MTGLKPMENRYCIGAAMRPVASGTAMARFFGTSSPKIIDPTVETMSAMVSAIGAARPGPTPQASNSGASSLPKDGSMR